MTVTVIARRHDEAIQKTSRKQVPGLLRSARNDGQKDI